jgi:hypothetical protein
MGITSRLTRQSSGVPVKRLIKVVVLVENGVGYNDRGEEICEPRQGERFNFRILERYRFLRMPIIEYESSPTRPHLKIVRDRIRA